jgi:hypothetical protein
MWRHKKVKAIRIYHVVASDVDKKVASGKGVVDATA